MKKTILLISVLSSFTFCSTKNVEEKTEDLQEKIETNDSVKIRVAPSDLASRFEKIVISVETPITPDGGIVVGNGIFDYGTMVSVRAIPRKGYKFIGWYEDEILVSNDTVYNFQAEKNRKMVGYFK